MLVPLLIGWNGDGGMRVLEHAVTEDVSKHGAAVCVKTRPLSREVVLVKNGMSKTCKARVVRVQARPDRTYRVCLDLNDPNLDFWQLEEQEPEPAEECQAANTAWAELTVDML